MDSIVVMTGLAEIITASAPVEFEDLRRNPNDTEPKIWRSIVASVNPAPGRLYPPSGSFEARRYHSGTRDM